MNNNRDLFRLKMDIIFRGRKYKIKNKTEYPIFVKLSVEKLSLDITNIRAGATVS